MRITTGPVTLNPGDVISWSETLTFVDEEPEEMDHGFDCEICFPPLLDDE